MALEIVVLPAMRVAAVRHVGPFDQVSKAFETLGRLAGPAGLFSPTAQMLTVFQDDPEATPADTLRSDAGVTCAEGVPLPAGLQEVRVEGGRFARAVHVGPYEGLGDAWRALKRSAGAAGQQTRSAPGFEIYRNTPMDTPKAQLRTELYLPIV